MNLRLFWCVALAPSCAPFQAAQVADNTTLKQVIILGRHAARTPVAPNSVLNSFSSLPFPDFAVAGQSVITPHGKTNEKLLGGYFRLWLTGEKLLTGNDRADTGFVTVRADNAPLMVDTAQAFVEGLLPAAPAQVSTVPGPDPLFDPIDAGLATLDGKMAVAAVNGRLGSDPQALSAAYAAEFARMRSVLFDYPQGTTPVPPTPPGKTDITTLPITVTVGTGTAPVGLGGLAAVYTGTDPFLMEYVDGMAISDVGWGRLDAAAISQILRVHDKLIDLEYRTPYLAAVQSSNLASHIVRTLVRSATGNAMGGTVGNPADKAVVLIATEANVAGLAGLLRLDWLVNGYQPDVPGLGGALVFQLRQSQTTGEFIVRAAYVTQTVDQLRSLTPLTLANPPASVPVLIPGCSIDNSTFDCPLAAFVGFASQQIDSRFIDLNN